MNSRKTLFWCAIIAQVIGAQVFFWDALPDYQELTAGAVVVGTPRDFVVAVFGLVLMQSAYWYGRRLQPQNPIPSTRCTGPCPALCQRGEFLFRQRAGNSGRV